MNPAHRFPWSARVALTLALGVLLFAVTTIVRWTGPAVALAYAWEPGEVVRDRMTMGLTMRIRPALVDQEFEVEMTLTSVTRVVDVDGEGNATLEVTTEDVEVVESNLPGPRSDLTAQLQEPLTMVVAPDGRILESSNAMFGPEGIQNQRYTAIPLLPDRPVAPGDRWELDHFQKFAFAKGGFDLHARNELLRYDEVNGVETVVVRSDLSGPFDLTVDPADLPPELLPEPGMEIQTAGQDIGAISYTGSISSEGDSWVDPLTGEVLRSQGEGTASITFGIGPVELGVPRITMEMELEMETERLLEG